MNRRETVLALLTLGIAPLHSLAQQPDKVYRIGYLSLGSPAAEATRFNAFRAGLAALGYVEGKNLVIETRWLEGGKYDQLAELAAQLVDLNVDIIVTYAALKDFGVSDKKRNLAAARAPEYRKACCYSPKRQPTVEPHP